MPTCCWAAAGSAKTGAHVALLLASGLSILALVGDRRLMGAGAHRLTRELLVLALAARARGRIARPDIVSAEWLKLGVAVPHARTVLVYVDDPQALVLQLQAVQA